MILQYVHAFVVVVGYIMVCGAAAVFVLMTLDEVVSFVYRNVRLFREFRRYMVWRQDFEAWLKQRRDGNEHPHTNHL